MASVSERIRLIIESLFDKTGIKKAQKSMTELQKAQTAYGKGTSEFNKKFKKLGGTISKGSMRMRGFKTSINATQAVSSVLDKDIKGMSKAAKYLGTDFSTTNNILKKSNRKLITLADGSQKVKNQMTGATDDIATGMNKARGETKRFRFENLSLMFGMMQLSRTTGKFLKPAAKAAGLTEQWGNTLETTMTPAMEAIRPAFEAFNNAMRNMPPFWKKAIGFLLIGAFAISKVGTMSFQAQLAMQGLNISALQSGHSMGFLGKMVHFTTGGLYGKIKTTWKDVMANNAETASTEKSTLATIRQRIADVAETAVKKVKTAVTWSSSAANLAEASSAGLASIATWGMVAATVALAVAVAAATGGLSLIGPILLGLAQKGQIIRDAFQRMAAGFRQTAAAIHEVWKYAKYFMPLLWLIYITAKAVIKAINMLSKALAGSGLQEAMGTVSKSAKYLTMDLEGLIFTAQLLEGYTSWMGKKWEDLKSKMGKAGDFLPSPSDIKSKLKDIKNIMTDLIFGKKKKGKEKRQGGLFGEGGVFDNPKEKITDFGFWLSDNTPDIPEKVQEGASDVANTVGSVIGDIGDNIEGGINAAGSWLSNNIPDIPEKVQEGASAVANTVGSVVGDIGDNIEGGINDAGSWLSNNTPDIPKKVQQGASTVASTVGSVVGDVKSKTTTKINETGTWLDDHTPDIPQAVPDAASNVKKTVGSTLGDVIDKVHIKINDLDTWLDDHMPDLSGDISDMWSSAIETTNKLEPLNLPGIGFGGIDWPSPPDWLTWGALKDFSNSIISNITNALDISKVKDFIWRPGQGITKIHPNDTVMGLKNSEPLKSRNVYNKNIEFNPRVTVNATVRDEVDIDDLKDRLSKEWVDELEGYMR